MSFKPFLTLFTVLTLSLPAAAAGFDEGDLAGDYGLRFLYGPEYPGISDTTRVILGGIHFDGEGLITRGRLLIEQIDLKGLDIDPATGDVVETGFRTEYPLLRHETAVTGSYRVSPEGLVRIELDFATPEPRRDAGGNTLYVRWYYPQPRLTIDGVLSDSGALIMAHANRRIEEREYTEQTRVERLKFLHDDAMPGELRRQRPPVVDLRARIAPTLR